MLPSVAQERTQSFDRDPGWDGHNNRSDHFKPREVRQDFGYSRTAHAGGEKGEIGGWITPAAEPAYYAKKLEAKTLADTFSASGKLMCKGRVFHILLGFFNKDTINEWRTPNSIVIRLQGRGDVFFAYVEYTTQLWRAGGDTPGGFTTVRDTKTGRLGLNGFPLGKSLNWSLKYDPKGNGGTGTITVSLADETSICHLSKGHKADGATFNRFGMMTVSKSAAAGGDVYFDDIEVNGDKHDFARDPEWEGFQNRRTFVSTNVRPRFDFGYSPTQHAGGKSKGELGGLTFRGDCRYPNKLAHYGDRLETLSLAKPMRASGKVCLRRGVTDSTTLLGFYHAKDSLEVNPAQTSGWPRGFLGVAIEGPSREGFLFYPAYRVKGEGQGHATGATRPRILPDGKPHDWSLVYDPAGNGRITVTFDRQTTTVDLAPGDKKTGAYFDRFGLITTWIDGNGQEVYFDDLVYTWKQE
jgi:hypothetical protein